MELIFQWERHMATKHMGQTSFQIVIIAAKSTASQNWEFGLRSYVWKIS